MYDETFINVRTAELHELYSGGESCGKSPWARKARLSAGGQSGVVLLDAGEDRSSAMEH